jgi:AraC-like DNA-binding protein
MLARPNTLMSCDVMKAEVDIQAKWPPHTDPLGEALHSLRMSGVMYCRCDLTAPWSLALPIMKGCLMFHVVTSGQFWLDVEGDDARARLVRQGDLALVPGGDGHTMASAPELAASAPALFDVHRSVVSERYELLTLGGGGAGCQVMCGAVKFDHPAAQHLVTLLPRTIHVEAWSSPETDWIDTTLRFIAAEARELRPGGETVITRLADILVIQAIRWWIRQAPAAQTGWLGALRDRQIGTAITLINRNPERAWTVAALAGEVAMSRSAFAARFATLVGEPPMHYVARSRMHLARTWLEEEDTSLAELATRLGYESDAAFSRAFKRFIGVSPGAIRRGDR